MLYVHLRPYRFNKSDKWWQSNLGGEILSLPFLLSKLFSGYLFSLQFHLFKAIIYAYDCKGHVSVFFYFFYFGYTASWKKRLTLREMNYHSPTKLNFKKVQTFFHSRKSFYFFSLRNVEMYYRIIIQTDSTFLVKTDLIERFEHFFFSNHSTSRTLLFATNVCNIPVLVEHIKQKTKQYLLKTLWKKMAPFFPFFCPLHAGCGRFCLLLMLAH